MHHSCNIVIMMHHKHGNGDTLTFYGTEGAGVSFIGNKADIKASEGGKMALMLFRKFMEGKCCLKCILTFYKEHFNWSEFSCMARNFSFLCLWELNAPESAFTKNQNDWNQEKTNIQTDLTLKKSRFIIYQIVHWDMQVFF